MNSLALLGELSCSLGSFLPCVPRQRLSVPGGSLGAITAAGGARPVPVGNFCTAGRRNLCRQSLSIVAMSINTKNKSENREKRLVRFRLPASGLAGRSDRSCLSLGPSCSLDSTSTDEKPPSFDDRFVSETFNS